MKVLFLTNMYPDASNVSYGAFVRAQAESLRRLGVQIDVLYVKGRDGPTAYLFAIRQLRDKLRTGEYDLVHVHYGTTALIALFQSVVPVVASFCGTDINGVSEGTLPFKISKNLQAALFRHLARHVHYSIVKSREMRDKIKSDRVVVIPNGIDLEEFRPLDQGECRRALGIDLEKKYVLFPYPRDRVGKGFDILERAVRRLNRSDVDVLAVSNVPHDRMPLFYNAADALALPSSAEGSPNAVKEAMACNLPVVATAVGDIPQLIGGAPGCRICERNDSDLAAKLEDVIDAGRAHGLRELVHPISEVSVGRRVIEIYQKVLDTEKKEGLGRRVV